MILALLTAAGGLFILSLILTARWLESRYWRARLVAYRLQLPSGLTAEQIAAWLGVLAADTRRWPVSFEVQATHQGIRYYLLVPAGQEASTLARLRSALPGLRTEEAPDYLTDRPAVRVASEYRLTNLQRPLGHDRAESAVTALLSGLHPLASSEAMRIQWILSGSRTFLPSKDDAAELARAVRAKNAAPVFNVVTRVAISAPSRARAISLLNRVTNAFKMLDAPGVSILPRAFLSTSTVAERVYGRTLPLTVWPMRLNTNEAAGLLGIPLGNVYLPGLELGRSRQLPPRKAWHARGSC
ncbi:hypothetical protein SSPO_027100 [Streptomyces antimycoticus]|uniref:Type VII secretion protein EccE n=1 Tax=Streptomyces antimycoticus TaxID=68175 RepID=A0A499UH91_9ACTN|nr:hypothetical protein [Streptomyces antimycoticus]BBJ39992.1 hypothetical protein SSPO_027100 [Streptomyces antimycoticus]